jgi:hypothetical protein
LIKETDRSNHHAVFRGALEINKLPLSTPNAAAPEILDTFGAAVLAYPPLNFASRARA